MTTDGCLQQSLPARASCGAWRLLHSLHGKSGVQWLECRTQGLRGKGIEIQNWNTSWPETNFWWTSSLFCWKSNSLPTHNHLTITKIPLRQCREFWKARCSYRQQWALKPTRWEACWWMFQLKHTGYTHKHAHTWLSLNFFTTGSTNSKCGKMRSHWFAWDEGAPIALGVTAAGWRNYHTGGCMGTFLMTFIDSWDVAPVNVGARSQPERLSSIFLQPTSANISGCSRCGFCFPLIFHYFLLCSF